MKPPSCVEIEEKVRYSETDRMGVAHNKSYFEWFELGRTEYCRRRGFPYRRIEERGYFLVVVEAFCRYKRPLHYDEPFIIRTFLRELTPKKAVFEYELVTKDGRRPVASGQTIHLVTDGRARVTPLPREILEHLLPETE